MPKYLVTSALIYANGPVHLGHVAGAYLPADVYVRFRRLNGDDVIFISGTDEHGVPITLKAEKEGVSPQEIVDRYHKMTDDSFQRLGISFDNYSGTARPYHRQLSQKFFLNLLEGDHIMTKTEEQFYDEKSERFLPDRYVEGTCPKCSYEKARGDQCDKCGSLLNPMELIEPRSALTGAKPVIKSTEHWYLKLQDFEKDIISWMESNTHWKDNVRKFILGWVGKEGLHERAITRDMKWGIPVPLDEAKGKVLYVWFDAPIGYISSTVEWAERIGQPDKWKDYWLDRENTRLIHFIGKDNIPFHAVIWPAMLMGQKEGYVLPYDVPANEYLNLEGDKLSTSNNWAVWVHEYLDDFPPDPLRYFLASNAPETKDSDFSWKGFQSRNNDDLANILGNFANRTLTFLRKYFDGIIPAGDYHADDESVFEQLKDIAGRLSNAFENYKVREASKLMMDISRLGNKYFDENKPWALRKNDLERLKTVMNVCLNILRVQAVAMYPIIPFSAEKLWKMIGETGEITGERWENLSARRIQPGTTIPEPEILFVKYEDAVIEAQINKLYQKSGRSPKKEEPVEEQELVTIDEFKKFDIRVAEIVEATPLEKSKKLIKLKVKVGDTEKQILAGIKEFYGDEDLVGRKIVMINNLQPAKLMGEESQGMLLAASDADRTTLSLLTPDKDMSSGSKIS